MKIKPLSYPKTTAEAYAYFKSHGISVAQWSRTLGLSNNAVKEALLGRTKGIRGNAHKAAVALGLKPEPKE